MISLKQVISQFQAFATAHKHIGKFGYEFKEQMGNLATVDEHYPYFFVVPMGATTLQNVVEFELDVYCVDRLQKDRTNTNFIVSDTQLILTDFTVWLEDGDHAIEVERIYPMTPVNNDLLDYVSGWFVRVRVQVERVSLCEVPMDGITPGDFTCADAIYNIYDTDGTLLYTGTVASGGELNQTIADSTVTITDDNGNLLYTLPIVAEGLASQAILDGIATVKDSDSNVLSTWNVLAEGTVDAFVLDSTAVLKDTANNTLSTTSILAEGSADIVAPDATVENSDASYTDTVASGGTLVLPDTTYDVYVNGVFNQSVNLITLKNETLNINA